MINYNAFFTVAITNIPRYTPAYDGIGKKHPLLVCSHSFSKNYYVSSFSKVYVTIFFGHFFLQTSLNNAEVSCDYCKALKNSLEVNW